MSCGETLSRPQHSPISVSSCEQKADRLRFNQTKKPSNLFAIGSMSSKVVNSVAGFLVYFGEAESLLTRERHLLEYSAILPNVHNHFLRGYRRPQPRIIIWPTRKKPIG